jgi:hypothetical protein
MTRLINVPVHSNIQQNIRKNSVGGDEILEEYLHAAEYQSLVDEAQVKYIVEKVKQARQALSDQGGPLVDARKVIVEYEQMDLSTDRRPIKAVVYSSGSNTL